MNTFKVYGQPLAIVSSFSYLGRTLTATDDNWPAVVGNLRKEIWTWERLLRIPGREVGGRISVDLGEVVLGGGTGNSPFRVINVGGDPPYGKDPGGVPLPGEKTDHRAATQ